MFRVRVKCRVGIRGAGLGFGLRLGLRLGVGIRLMGLAFLISHVVFGWYLHPSFLPALLACLL